MSTAETTRTCLDCNQPLYGRADKKYCNDQCRNTYNNRTGKSHNAYVRKVTGILKKNRKILAELNPTGRKKAKKDTLLKAGFDFGYFTSVFTNKEGKEYRYCFDQGYLSLGEDWYFLVHKPDYEKS